MHQSRVFSIQHLKFNKSDGLTSRARILDQPHVGQRWQEFSNLVFSVSSYPASSLIFSLLRILQKTPSIHQLEQKLAPHPLPLPLPLLALHTLALATPGYQSYGLRFEQFSTTNSSSSAKEEEPKQGLRENDK